MRIFTRENIDRQREDFRKAGYSEKPASFENHSFSYFLLPQKLNPALPDFAFRMTGSKEDGYLIGVCESVPAVYRPLWGLHEYLEFVVLGMNVNKRCTRAMEEELKIARNIFKPQGEQDRIFYSYLRRRKLFFENLIQYASTNAQSFTKDEISQFRANKTLLEALVQVSDDKIKAV